MTPSVDSHVATNALNLKSVPSQYSRRREPKHARLAHSFEGGGVLDNISSDEEMRRRLVVLLQELVEPFALRHGL